MTLTDPGHAPKLGPDLIAEAAAWIAMLHGPSRTAELERSFDRWLRTSELHARAFEEATQVWDESGDLAAVARAWRTRTAPGASSPRWRASAWRPIVAGASLLVLVVLGVLILMRSGGESVRTAVGEQRTLPLEDGSRIIMNTATNVVVQLSKEFRRVELRDGEALFEVAKDAGRPFVVVAGDQHVKALGTSFVVRRESSRVAVILVEGRVTVSSGTASPGTVLAPGERLTVEALHRARVDHPQIDRVLAWQRREVSLDNTPLAEAIAEMNRYSSRPLVFEGGSADAVFVTGLFRAGDSLNFARAVGVAYGFEVDEQPARIVLRK